MAAAETTSNKKVVTLEDGSTAEFGEKQKMQLEVGAADVGFAYRAVFANGKILTGNVPAELAEKLALHGLGQKLRDSISGEKTIADAIGAFEDVADTLSAGDWSQVRSGDGPKANKTELAEAIASVRGIELEVAVAWLSQKTPAEKIKLRAVPAVALKIAEMRAEKARAEAAENAGAGDDVFAGLGEVEAAE